MTIPTDKNGKPATRKTSTQESIPIVEERVTVGTTTATGRTVTVKTRPITEQVAINRTLKSETVSVKRVPIDRVIEVVPQVREEKDLIVVPVVEERVTVTVELILKEEVHLRRISTNTLHEETVNTSRTEVDITEST